MQEIKITKWLFQLPARQDPTWQHFFALCLPSKSHRGISCILVSNRYKKVVHFVTRSQCYEIFVSITEYFGKRVIKLYKGLYVYPRIYIRMRKAPSKCYEIFASKFLSILEIFFSVSFSLLFIKFEGVLWLSLPTGRSVTQLIPHRIRKPDFT